MFKEALIKRRTELQEWLADNAPYCTVDQNHLDEHTKARAYWHYGYYVALNDILNLYDKAE